MENQNNFKEVGKLYDSNNLAKFWEWLHDRHMHVAFFDETNPNATIAEGSRKLTDIVIAKVPIKENGTFVDVGCGFGLPAIELAKQKKCNVYGITASDYQKSEAEKTAQLENLSDRTHFLVCDAKQTSFSNDQFDAGWFFESIFHIGHVEALTEARRILKPNATLLIIDFLALPSLSPEDRKFLLDTFHSKTLLTAEEYQPLLEENGFRLVEMWNITEQTIKKRKDKYIEAFNNHKEEIIRFGGSEQFYNDMKNFWIATNEIFDKHIGYLIVTCEKK